MTVNTTGYQNGPRTQIIEDIRACTRCPLSQKAVPLPAMGGRIMLLLDGPSFHDSKVGVPLSGRVGQDIREAVRESGVEDVGVMYCVRCYGPRSSTIEGRAGLDQCHDWTLEELKVYDPRVVILMGKIPIEMVFGKTRNVSKVVEEVGYKVTGEGSPLGARYWLPFYHPNWFRDNPPGVFIATLHRAQRLIGVL